MREDAIEIIYVVGHHIHLSSGMKAPLNFFSLLGVAHVWY